VPEACVGKPRPGDKLLQRGDTADLEKDAGTLGAKVIDACRLYIASGVYMYRAHHVPSTAALVRQVVHGRVPVGSNVFRRVQGSAVHVRSSAVKL
jgi:hypothetical protein